MTIKERDELREDIYESDASDSVYNVIYRIILALPVEDDPPKPKPSMGAAVRELVRAAEDALPDVLYSDEQVRLGNAIAAVKDLFVEESQ